MERNFGLGKIYQKFILLEIFKYSHYDNELKEFLHYVSKKSRKYLDNNLKYFKRIIDNSNYTALQAFTNEMRTNWPSNMSHAKYLSKGNS